MLGILSLHAHRQMIYYHCDCIRFASKHSTEGFAVLILFPFLIFSFLFLMLGFLAYDSIFFFFLLLSPASTFLYCAVAVETISEVSHSQRAAFLVSSRSSCVSWRAVTLFPFKRINADTGVSFFFFLLFFQVNVSRSEGVRFFFCSCSLAQV